jgi:DNA-binding NtrC family response regulator
MADRPRVLLADSDPHCIESLEPALKHITELAIVNNTDAAVQVLAQGAQFDVVCVDVELPAHGGLWLLEQVARALPRSHRVLMSAPRPQDFPSLVQRGVAHDLVRKPVLIDNLVAVIMGAPSVGMPTQG